MPDGKPTKAPVIIFGTMVTMSIITVGIVFYTHSRRTEPYLESKRLRLEYARPAKVAPVAEAAEALDAAPLEDAGSLEGAAIDGGTTPR